MPDDTDRRVLEAISTLIEEVGVPPTMREILDFLDWSSVSRLQGSLARLRDAGEISWQEGMSRTLRIEDEQPPR